MEINNTHNVQKTYNVSVTTEDLEKNKTSVADKTVLFDSLSDENDVDVEVVLSGDISSVLQDEVKGDEPAALPESTQQKENIEDKKEVPEDKPKEEVKKKRTAEEFFQDVGEWLDEQFGKPARKAADDVQHLMDLMDIDPNEMKTDTKDKGVSVRTEAKYSGKFNNTSVDIASSSYNDALVNNKQNYSFSGNIKTTNKVGDKLVINSTEDLKADCYKENVPFADSVGVAISNRMQNGGRFVNINEDLKYNISIKDTENAVYTIYDNTPEDKEAKRPDGLQNLNTHTTLVTDAKKSNDNSSVEFNIEEGVSVSYKEKDTNLSAYSTASTDIKVFDDSSKNAISFKFDNGASMSYKINDKLKGSASLSDVTGYGNDILTNKFSLTGDLNYNNVLYEDKEKQSKLSFSTKLDQSFVFDTSNNFLNDEFKWSTNLHTGISTSMTYKINPDITLGAKVNASYDFASGDDKYSFGGGISADYTPFSWDRNFKISGGVTYQQSDFVSPDIDKLSQTLGLTASVDFTKEFGVNASYNIYIDGKKPNDFNFGVKMNF